MGGCLCAPFSIEKNYIFENSGYIGKGSNSKVLRARHRLTGEVVAVKMIAKDSATERNVWEDEVTFMKQVSSHPNVIQLKEVYSTVIVSRCI